MGLMKRCKKASDVAPGNACVFTCRRQLWRREGELSFNISISIRDGVRVSAGRQLKLKIKSSHEQRSRQNRMEHDQHFIRYQNCLQICLGMDSMFWRRYRYNQSEVAASKMQFLANILQFKAATNNYFLD